MITQYLWLLLLSKEHQALLLSLFSSNQRSSINRKALKPEQIPPANQIRALKVGLKVEREIRLKLIFKMWLRRAQELKAPQILYNSNHKRTTQLHYNN